MTVRPWVLVVSETPSLARSITDLLESDGHRVATPVDPGREFLRRLKDREEPVRLVISASNGFYCETARRWMRGEVQGVDLIVVGSRDPGLRSGPHLHVIGLPLAPDAFLTLVRSLLDRAAETSAAVAGQSARRSPPPPGRTEPKPPGSVRAVAVPRAETEPEPEETRKRLRGAGRRVLPGGIAPA